MLHGLLPDLWGLVFAWLPPRDLLQFLLVDKAFSAEIRHDKHWRHRAGQLRFFTRLARVARQLDGDEKGAHTLELAYYCMALSLGTSIDWASEYERRTRQHQTSVSIILQKHALTYEIHQSRRSSTVEMCFPLNGGDWMHVYSHSQLSDYAYEFMAMTSGAPRSLIERPIAAPAA